MAAAATSAPLGFISSRQNLTLEKYTRALPRKGEQGSVVAHNRGGVCAAVRDEARTVHAFLSLKLQKMKMKPETQ